MKTCSRCKIEKPESDFYQKKGHAISTCKECCTVLKKIYRSDGKNKEKELESHKVWLSNNKQRVKEKSHEWRANNLNRCRETTYVWRQNNPERFKEINNKATTKRNKTPAGRLNNSIRAAIILSLKGTKSGRSWCSLVGYTRQQLKKHLEKQFDSKMTWNNYGEYWHLDHKVPRSVFNFANPEDIDFKKCWALPNLQPLEARENMRKQNKIDCPFQPSLTLSV